MKPQLVLAMALDATQTARLVELQKVFAQACNHLAPIVQQTRCWNRVALHHLAYRELRTRFPALGSQMACNAIYSVSRTCRALFQSRNSPYALHRLGQAALPRVLFLPQSPVYFDRHTLSLRDGRVSMFTLDGRMHFQLALDERQEALFRGGRLREVVLGSTGAGLSLAFTFDEPSASGTAAPRHVTDDGLAAGADATADSADLPDYVLVDDAAPPWPAQSRVQPRPAPAPAR